VAEDRRLIARLTAADRSLAEQRLPPRAVRRIANRIAKEIERPTRARRLGWIPMLTFVAGAALVLMFVAWTQTRGGDEGGESAIASGPTQEWARISGPDCHHRQVDDDSIELSGACEAVTTEPAMRIQSVESASIALERRRVQLQGGSALFDVDPVIGDPVRIAVPGGEIVVIGTRFRVVIHERGGQVELYEGKLEFHADDGSVTPIFAGQQFAFGKRTNEAPREALPSASTPEPTIPASAPAEPAKIKRRPETPPATQTSEPSAAPIIEEVQQLRRRGEYERAASRLREALQQRWPTRTADVLSYELGTILARHLHDDVRACAHWRAHLQTFHATRYRRQIVGSIADLGCP
jgi:hypothetical protein